MWDRTCKNRCALIDLVERVGANDKRAGTFASVDDDLGNGKQRLARAVDRQYLAGWIDILKTLAIDKPVADGRTQIIGARGGWVVSQAVDSLGYSTAENLGRRVLGLPDVKLNWSVQCRRNNALEKASKPFEGIRLQQREFGVHVSEMPTLVDGFRITCRDDVRDPAFPAALAMLGDDSRKYPSPYKESGRNAGITGEDRTN